MLSSLVLTVRPLEAGAKPANLGRAVHAFLLGWVGASDPALVEALHEAAPPRPFTCSLLARSGRQHAGNILCGSTQIKGNRIKIQLSRFHSGKIQYIVDYHEQRLRAFAHGFRILTLFFG